MPWSSSSRQFPWRRKAPPPGSCWPSCPPSSSSSVPLPFFPSLLTWILLLVMMSSSWLSPAGGGGGRGDGDGGGGHGRLPPLAHGRSFPFGTSDDEDLDPADSIASSSSSSSSPGFVGLLDGEDCGSSGCGPQYDEFEQYDDALMPLLDSCKLEGCWQLYQKAQTSLGLGDGFSSSSRDSRDGTTPSPQVLRDRCIALRTYRRCIQNTTRCKGNLNYHTSAQVAQSRMEAFNCSMNGTVFDPSRSPRPSDRRPAPPPPCSFSSQGSGGRKPEEVEHRHCGLFGDPHLRTFNNEFQTCKVQGAWPLLDNRYLTVQVTNDPVGLWEGTATAISKLTVVIKQHECAAHHFVTYQAQTDLLPDVFDDGRAALGPEDAVRIRSVDPGRHVEIYMRYIDTTLIIRQIGRFFTFAVRMPERVIRSTSRRAPSSAASMQLCVKGCPHGERIDYKQFLARKHGRLKMKSALDGGGGGDEQTTSRAGAAAMSRDAAEALCRKARVVDFYFDSCVFDLMTTGDTNFTLAASRALSDVLKLMPHTARMHKNRTDLRDLDKEYTSAASPSLHGPRRQVAHRTVTYGRILLLRQHSALLLWAVLVCAALTRGSHVV